MSKFQDQAAAYRVQRATPAPTTIVLQPHDFASDWAQRPKEPICCGLRVLSADAEDSAKEQARKKAIETDTDDVQAELEKQYLIFYCAMALCDPNDVERHCEPFDMASDQLPAALTSSALLRIYDTAERLKIETSPLFPEAANEDLDELAGELLGGALQDLEKVDSRKAARVRRYARFILDDLRT